WERGAIAGGAQTLLAIAAPAPHWSDCVDDVLGLQAIAAGDLGRSGLAAAQRPTFDQQLGSGGAMDRTVDPAATEQRAVRRVDDRVDVQRRDVGDTDLQPRRADLGGEEGRGDHARIVAQICAARDGGYSLATSSVSARSIVLRRPMSSKCASRKRRVARWPSLRSISKYS